MWQIALYLGFLILGYMASNKAKWKYTGKTLVVSAFLLVFLLGVVIGSDEKVFASLGSIGVTSFALAFFAMGGSVCAVIIVRKLLKMDKRGVKADE